jgi:hypothetical protein
MALLEPKEVRIVTLKGDERVYIISKFPAVTGREIVCSYPISAIPKLNEYSANEAVMMKLMSFVGIPRAPQAGIPAEPLLLNTRALIDNHVPDWETLVKIELEMMRYNTSFFQEGVVSTFCGNLIQKAMRSITPTLTPLLRQLSEIIRQRSPN